MNIYQAIIKKEFKQLLKLHKIDPDTNWSGLSKISNKWIICTSRNTIGTTLIVFIRLIFHRRFKFIKDCHKEDYANPAKEMSERDRIVANAVQNNIYSVTINTEGLWWFCNPSTLLIIIISFHSGFVNLSSLIKWIC